MNLYILPTSNMLFCVQALRDGKRVVTAHWLNDVLVQKRVAPPWMALHFPSIYGKEKPCANQVRSITPRHAKSLYIQVFNPRPAGTTIVVSNPFYQPFNPLTAKLFNLNFTHVKLCLADAIQNFK